jgi:antagonist of KipI
VGNDDEAAALELTLLGPELQARGDVTCAVAGATFSLTAGVRPVAMHHAFTLRAGERLRFGERIAGARATLAVRGGFNVGTVFDSRATSLISRMGPFEGRALRAGDELPVGGAMEAQGTAGRPLPLPSGGARLRVILGPHEAMFTPAGIEALLSGRFIVTPHSNRMGYRLEGPRIEHAAGADILSDATPIGSLQVPASGQPILLMADRQTTGGYPKIATVITADLPLGGQLAPGDWIEFARCTRADAIASLKAREARLSGAA